MYTKILSVYSMNELLPKSRLISRRLKKRKSTSPSSLITSLLFIPRRPYYLRFWITLEHIHPLHNHSLVWPAPGILFATSPNDIRLKDKLMSISSSHIPKIMLPFKRRISLDFTSHIEPFWQWWGAWQLFFLAGPYGAALVVLAATAWARVREV